MAEKQLACAKLKPEAVSSAVNKEVRYGKIQSGRHELRRLQFESRACGICC